MSIIGFRTVIKETRDIAFVFLALAAGMAAGTSYNLIAMAGTGSMLELSCFVRLKAPERTREFVQHLGAVEGIEGVSLIAMEEAAEA